jgi:hypothetical protein
MNKKCKHCDQVPYSPGWATNPHGPVVFKEERCEDDVIEGSDFCEFHKRAHDYDVRIKQEAWNKAVKNSPSIQKFIKENVKAHE